MAGEWHSDDLCGLLTVLATVVSDLVPPPIQWLRPIAHIAQPRPPRDGTAQARHNVAAHYDLSNELFAEFLDETMTYSCALFTDLPASWSDLPGRSDARSTGCLTLPECVAAAAYWRSGPVGASCASVRPQEERMSAR
ncbi:mycolic acid cyclopropane synthetase family protein [Mycobacterium xenopi 3993]|nr:mycolic acid cyclopropane synthetase family protein [Mycobacterium xenopi 3993]